VPRPGRGDGGGELPDRSAPPSATIVAEVSLAASLLGDLDAEALRAAALGDFSADLTFDHME
jgi:hypothetical protein